MKAVLVLSCLLLAATTARAQQQQIYLPHYLTGNKLLEVCASPGGDESLCLGYILGVADALSEWNYAHDADPCIRPEITGRQIKDIVINYLQQRPEHRSNDGALLTIGAITTALGCNMPDGLRRKFGDRQ
jgi:hypothetical protein